MLCRHFSTTPAVRAIKIPPHSPSYIRIPRARIPHAYPPRRLKGILPIPRTIFRRPTRGSPSETTKSGYEKGTPQYLASVTPVPTHEPRPAKDVATRAYQAWKATMAKKRRHNLRTGMTALQVRARETQRRRHDIGLRNRKAREEKLAAAERADVRLTLPSVLSTLRSGGYEGDPNRDERVAAMKARWRAGEMKKMEGRRKAIVDLYLRAGKFIVTEYQLDMEIARVFSNEARSLEGIMAQTRPVETVMDLIRRKAEGKYFAGPGDYSVVRDIAGALTGGPFMDEKKK